MKNNTFKILLVEDNPADICLTQELFNKGEVDTDLSVAKDGVEAMAFLRKKDGFENAQSPDLILLDLNMPRKDGREVLQELKNDPELRRIPIIVLTTSMSQEDIQNAYNLHANCYITKPVDLDQFIEMIRVIEEFWFKLVILPERATSCNQTS